MEFVEIETAVPIGRRTWQTQLPLFKGRGIRSSNLLASLNLLEIQVMNHPTKRVQSARMSQSFQPWVNADCLGSSGRIAARPDQVFG